MSTESIMPFNHPILCCPLLLLPSIFPSIRVFSNVLALQIRFFYPLTSFIIFILLCGFFFFVCVCVQLDYDTPRSRFYLVFFELPGFFIWYLSLILENSFSLPLQIFLLPCSLSLLLYYSNFTYVMLHFWEASHNSGL